MPRLSQRDLDALRLGIAEQERERLRDEDHQRLMETLREREYVAPSNVLLTAAYAALPGTRLACTDNGEDFYAGATVVHNDTTTPRGMRSARELWVETDDGCGRALDRKDTVLIVLEAAS